MVFKRISALVIKEFIAVWQDKKSRLFLILPPLIQLFVFAFAATLDVKNISFGVLNKDYGKESFELIRRFQGSPYFKNIIYLKNEKEIEDVIDNQKAAIVVHIDETFSRNIYKGEKANVQLILDGRKSNSAQIILGYASRIIGEYNIDLFKKVKYMLPQSISLPSKNRDFKAKIIPRNWFNPNLIYTWFTVPGLVALLTMTTALLVTAMTIARERELGTFDQLLVSPLTSKEILIGKAVPGVVIGVMEGTLILIAAIFAFQIPFTGSLIGLYLALFFFVCSIVGIGIFLSSLCSTQQQALLATFVFMSHTIILSGFATPIESMPIWLQKFTLINPLRYMLVIVRGIFLKDLPIKDILKNLYPIIIIAFFNLSIAGWFFRKKLS